MQPQLNTNNLLDELGEQPASQFAIRKLTTFELPLYADHLQRLNQDDRYLRFGYSITDEQIKRYVSSQMRIKSIVLACFSDNLEVVAAVEIVVDENKYANNNSVAEIGLSVEQDFRGKRLGSNLFNSGLLLCRNRGVKELVSHCLSQNKFMMRIARSNGMKIHSEQGESMGTLALTPGNRSTMMDELIGNGMGIWDYGLLTVPAMFNYAAFMLNK